MTEMKYPEIHRERQSHDSNYLKRLLKPIKLYHFDIMTCFILGLLTIVMETKTLLF